MKKVNFKMKKLLVQMLAVVMVCIVPAIHAFAEETSHSASTFLQLQSAISSAPADGAQHTITITADIALDGVLTIPSGTNIKIMSDGSGPWTFTQNTAVARHFIVNGSLTLENIILDGNRSAGGVAVSNGALTVNNGAVITKCYTGPAGAGCGIELAKSAFTMNGGEISYNRNDSGYGVSGGGVSLKDSTAEMKGGSIHHNASTWGGGVDIGIDSSFTMNGGEIYSNEATTESGGGVHVYVHGTFVMNSGRIYKNTATNSGAGGGVFVGQGSHVSTEPSDWCNFIMNGGTIEDNESYVGGGVGTFWNGNTTMNGGVIRNNSAQAGGGVAVGQPYSNTRVSFIMKNGEISGNRAASSYGGGVFVWGDQSPVDVQIGEKAVSAGSTPAIRENTASSQGGGMFIYQAAATMHNGTVAGNKAGGLGGGVCVSSGSTFTLNGGVIGGDIAKDANVTTGSSGGGVSTHSAGNTFIMTGGRVAGNEAKGAGGGGIYIGTSNTASITAGKITNNAASKNGGGIYIDSAASATVSGATISNNKADNVGGGIYNASASTAISDTVIRENTAISGGGVYAANNIQMKKASLIGNNAANGGGAYVTSASTLSVSDSTIFNGNRAGNEGGGIYTEDYTDYDNLTSADYQNIFTDITTTFADNIASAAYEPPAIVYDYANIRYHATSIKKAGNAYLHPINNYDINFVSGVPYVLYSVAYDANGGTGSHQDTGLPGGAIYTVLSDTAAGISYAGYTFTGWNTKADGSGTFYQPGETFLMTANVTLYAQWTAISVTPPENPKTGDHTNPVIPFLLLATATGMCITFLVKCRRHEPV